MEIRQGSLETMVTKPFWENKRVFITGHTGFKGSWLTQLLEFCNAKVFGYALAPSTDPSLYQLLHLNEKINSKFADILNINELNKSIVDCQPDIVFHMAAQPLVRESYIDPVKTYATNVMGTVHVLDAVRKLNKQCIVVIITTDKCYENKEWMWAYRENETLGGYDPYSNSKACAELVTSAYRQSFFSNDKKIRVASVRAGNVIGGGDWSNDRLIVDIVRSIVQKQPLSIRYPNAIRPWQHVLEPLSGYLLLAEQLAQNAELQGAWNFGPNEDACIRVKEIAEQFQQLWPHSFEWTIDSQAHFHEAHFLKLDSTKARQLLGWKPHWDIDTTLQKTVDWYQSWHIGKEIKQKTQQQINDYFNW